jgi:hypothetical protein
VQFCGKQSNKKILGERRCRKGVRGHPLCKDDTKKDNHVRKRKRRNEVGV